VMRNSTPPEGFKIRDRLDHEGDRISLGDAMNRREQARSANVEDSGKKTILIVDDSKSSRSLVRFVLQADGYEILEAEDGEQGWEAIQRMAGGLSLVITDFEMPKMTGPELVAKVREQSRFDGIPLILLTARKEEDDEVLGLESGADDYIGKPVEPMKLQIRVKKVMGMYSRIRNAVAQ